MVIVIGRHEDGIFHVTSYFYDALKDCKCGA